MALIILPNGPLLRCNGQVVEVDPAGGKQVYDQRIDTNQAQSSSGNADLSGMAVRPDGKGCYYVEDDMNTIVETR
jgi:hypothetical protein